MKIETDLKLDFSDVLFRPKRSSLSSRGEVNLTREIIFKNGVKWTGVPIIASNMDTVGTFEMYNVLHRHKIITCFHKHYNLSDYANAAAATEGTRSLDRNYYMISTGITKTDEEKLEQVIAHLDPLFVCIDVANGYMKAFVDFVKKIREKYPQLVIVCGNVVSREMVEELIMNCGADIVKVGIGSGSVCITRLQTGVGMPQLSAVIESSDSAHGLNGFIVSDGGCTTPADIAKAFGGGADFVMLGGMLAGHDESGGETIIDPTNTNGNSNNKYKLFYGMSSSTAMEQYHGGVASHRSAEGKTVKIPYRGPVESTILDILGGIRSTCTYIGAKRMKDIPKCTTFIRVTNQVNQIYSGKEHKA
jgi:GMP reductase